MFQALKNAENWFTDQRKEPSRWVQHMCMTSSGRSNIRFLDPLMYDKLAIWDWMGDCSRLTLKFRHIQTTGAVLIFRLHVSLFFEDILFRMIARMIAWMIHAKLEFLEIHFLVKGTCVSTMRSTCHISNRCPNKSSANAGQNLLHPGTRIRCFAKIRKDHQSLTPSLSKSPFCKLPLHMDPEHPAGSRGQLSQQYLKLLQQHLRLLKVWKHWLIDQVLVVGSTWTVGRQRMKKRDVLSCVF